MKLKDVEMLPGVVIVEDDPKLLGRVKATVPTLFDSSTMPEETLPWIYPLTMAHYQSYTKPRNGMKIWVFNNTANYHEYWYIPMFELCTDDRSIVNENNEVDILAYRMLGKGSFSIYHTQDQGIVQQVCDYKTQITPEGTINIDGAQSSFTITNSKCKAGKRDGDYVPVGNGTFIKQKFSQLASDLIDVAGKLSYPCSAAATALLTTANKLQQDLNKCELDNLLGN